MRIKKIFYKSGALALITAISPIALIATACNNDKKTNVQYSEADIQQAQEKFDKFEDSYNTTIKEKAKEYAQTKAAVDNMPSSNDNEAAAKKAAQDKLNEWLAKTRTEFANIKAQYREVFDTLKKVEKDSRYKTFKIYHTNDEHGRILLDDGKYNRYSGIEGIIQYMDGMPRDILLSAGDLVQGLPLSDSDKGETIAKLVVNAKYDLVTIGNHEFDYGLDWIRKLNDLTKAKGMPFLSANVVWKETKDGHTAGNFVFDRYKIFDINGAKIAVVGITTPDSAYTSNPKNSVDVNFLDPVTAMKAVNEDLKKQGVNFVIAATHLGVGVNNPKWESLYLGRETQDDTDLILDGHSHTKILGEKIDGTTDTYISQTQAYTTYLGDITIRFDTETGKIVKFHEELRDIDQIQVVRSGQREEEVDNLIKALQKSYSAVNDKVVFQNKINFTHVVSKQVGSENFWLGRVAQTNLGTFASDANVWTFYKENNARLTGDNAITADNTVGLTNGGGLRADLPAGTVKRGDIVKISPFGNRITAIKIKGSVLKEVFAHGAKKIKSGGYAQWSHNVSFEIVSTKGADGRATYSIKEGTLKINNKDIDDNKNYYLVTNDYLVVGGDQYSMIDLIKNPTIEKEFEGDSIADTIINYANALNTNDGIDNSYPLKWSIDKYNTDEATNFVKINYEN
ncbi:bifunctional metallophosphatase/5'-nucleotidase [Mycoplasmopsis meleagridis]|uniref:bifunctional metallophosphatase/5'-nucleotidase n=1 Tax=Mycoplasmopsis meleagridis TaxID=29561 RepID=UPI00073D5B34|nr:bifunctional UDP-sugar hydrolase/5'-nucleotidase [Mycoplasmopsis meleagridis]KUH47305.1 hypothetical protein ASB56_02190 [Mycoplasmopsis meleagridis]